MSYARSSAVMLGGQAAAFAIRIAGFSILAHLLAPEDFGLLAMAATVIGIAEVFRDAGLPMAAIQATELKEDEQDSLLWTNLALGMTFAAICVISAPAVADFYDEPRITALLRALAVVFVIHGLISQYAVRLIRADAYSTVVKVTVTAQVVGLVAAVVAIALGAGYWGLAIQGFVSALTTLTLCVVITRWLPRLRFRVAAVRPFVGFGSRLLAVNGLTYMARTVDRVGLGYAYGTHDVGLYSRAQQLSSIPHEAVNGGLSPLAVRYLVTGGIEPHRVRTMQTVSAWVVMLPVAIMAGAAVPLVELLLGAQWAPAAPILSVLCIGAAFHALGFGYYWLFLALGRTDLHLRCACISLPIGTAMVLAAVPIGAEWVPLAASLGVVVEWMVFALWGVRKVGQPVAPLLTGCLRPLAAGFVAAVGGRIGVLLLADAHAVVQLAGSAACALVAGGLLVLAVPSLRNDVQLVLQIIRRILKGAPLEESAP